MLTTYKIELYPTKEQESVLWSQSSLCNNMHNLLIATVKEEVKNCKTVPGFRPTLHLRDDYAIRDFMVTVKKDKPVYKAVYSNCMKGVADNIIKSIMVAGDYIATTQSTRGMPDFRSIRKCGFYTLQYNGLQGYKVFDKRLHLSLGKSVEGVTLKQRKRIYLDLEMEYKLPFAIENCKQLEVCQDKLSKRFYAHFSVDLPDKLKKPIERIIALDPNHKNLAVSYDSNKQTHTFDNFCPSKIIDIRINDIQVLRKACKVGSRRFKHLSMLISKLREVKRDQKQTYLRQMANWLCKNYDLIAIGNYVPFAHKGKRAMNKAVINETHIGEFRDILSHTCERSGKTYYLFDERDTTRTCHACGHVRDKIHPSIREWSCENKKCKASHLRDENAAQNGFKLALKAQDKVNKKLGNKLLKSTLDLPCSGYLPIGSLPIDRRYACRISRRHSLRLIVQEIKMLDENKQSDLS